MATAGSLEALKAELDKAHAMFLSSALRVIHDADVADTLKDALKHEAEPAKNKGEPPKEAPKHEDEPAKHGGEPPKEPLKHGDDPASPPQADPKTALAEAAAEAARLRFLAVLAATAGNVRSQTQREKQISMDDRMAAMGTGLADMRTRLLELQAIFGAAEDRRAAERGELVVVCGDLAAGVAIAHDAMAGLKNELAAVVQDTANASGRIDAVCERLDAMARVESVLHGSSAAAVAAPVDHTAAVVAPQLQAQPQQPQQPQLQAQPQLQQPQPAQPQQAQPQPQQAQPQPQQPQQAQHAKLALQAQHARLALHAAKSARIAQTAREGAKNTAAQELFSAQGLLGRALVARDFAKKMADAAASHEAMAQKAHDAAVKASRAADEALGAARQGEMEAGEVRAKMDAVCAAVCEAEKSAMAALGHAQSATTACESVGKATASAAAITATVVYGAKGKADSAANAAVGVHGRMNRLSLTVTSIATAAGIQLTEAKAALESATAAAIEARSVLTAANVMADYEFGRVTRCVAQHETAAKTYHDAVKMANAAAAVADEAAEAALHALAA